MVFVDRFVIVLWVLHIPMEDFNCSQENLCHTDFQICECRNLENFSRSEYSNLIPNNSFFVCMTVEMEVEVCFRKKIQWEITISREMLFSYFLWRWRNAQEWKREIFFITWNNRKNKALILTECTMYNALDFNSILIIKILQVLGKLNIWIVWKFISKRLLLPRGSH